MTFHQEAFKAFHAAITAVGIKEFKKCSFFIRNDIRNYLDYEALDELKAKEKTPDR